VREAAGVSWRDEDAAPDEAPPALDSPEVAIAPLDAVSCAIGILMQRYGCDVEGAAERLAQWSRETAIDVPLVAAWLIDDVSALWHRE